MALLSSPSRSVALDTCTGYVCLVASGLVVLLFVLAACTDAAPSDEADTDSDAVELVDAPRRYSAQWLIDTEAIGRDDEVSSPMIYREVVDDRAGSYLVETPNHLASQRPDEIVFCAAISRIPLDPFCAASPRASGAPNVLSFPVQLLKRDWGPKGLYELANYREVSLVAASDPDNWASQITTAPAGFEVECFLVIGDTPAATTGFEICYTNDELRLVASVDLQADLIFEIELLRYEQLLAEVEDDFETGLDEFVLAQPSLQEQLLDLYPEIPAPRPTPTPDLGSEDQDGS